MRQLPPLNAIRAFEAAARHLSFNRAAEELHVTPSAISHQVRTLESTLGVVLFHRHSRQIALTEPGQALLPPLSTALDQMAAAVRRVTLPSTLMLSVTPSFAAEWLIPRLASFQQQYPDCEVRLATHHQTPQFNTSDIDLAIVAGRGGWRHLRSHRLLTEQIVPVCSPSLLPAAGQSAESSANRQALLRRLPLIHVITQPERWRQWLQAAGLDVAGSQHGPRFQTTTLALEAAENGLGIALANRVFVEAHLHSGRLCVPIDLGLPTERDYFLVYPDARAAYAASGSVPRLAARYHRRF